MRYVKNSPALEPLAIRSQPMTAETRSQRMLRVCWFYVAGCIGGGAIVGLAHLLAGTAK